MGLCNTVESRDPHIHQTFNPFFINQGANAFELCLTCFLRNQVRLDYIDRATGWMEIRLEKTFRPHGTLTSLLDCFRSKTWSDSEQQPVTSNNRGFCLHLQGTSEQSNATSCILWLSVLWYKLMAFLVWPRSVNSSSQSHFSVARQSSSTHLQSSSGWQKIKQRT